ncbi:tyrosine-type recombinase/integrase [Roseovarius aestuarii]|nr:tyrosine-type recombinase/integrase [Roseovarius aestuarii]
MSRPPKPRITKRRLVWKWNPHRETWQPYHRITWTEGGKQRERAILLDWQGDSELLDALFWACESNRHDKQKPAPPRYSWEALILEWRADPRVQKRLTDGTKRSYRRDMDRIREKNGPKDVRHTTRQALRAAHDKLAETPRKADKYLATVSLLWNYAVKTLDWPLDANPASGIEHFGKQREFEPWPAWLIAKLPTAPAQVRIAAELILGTGQRPNAAITMRFDQFQGDWMVVIDEKGDKDFETYCPPRLRTFVASVPKAGAYLLAKNLSEPLGYNVVQKSFARWRNALGDKARPYTLHGLRKLAIIELAEAGCTDAEIQAVTGQSAQMVAYYRSRASRRTLSRSAQQRRE